MCVIFLVNSLFNSVTMGNSNASFEPENANHCESAPLNSIRVSSPTSKISADSASTPSQVFTCIYT